MLSAAIVVVSIGRAACGARQCTVVALERFGEMRLTSEPRIECDFFNRHMSLSNVCKVFMAALKPPAPYKLTDSFAGP